MTLNRRQTILGLGVTAAVLATGGGASAHHTLTGPAFGSTWRVIPGTHATEAAAVRIAIEKIIHEIDTAMSPYKPVSEITRFNEMATTDWHPLSAATAHVTSEALRIADRTSGAFDPTVGPLVGRYGFGPITGALGGYGDLAISEGAVRKDIPGLTLDLCGIAKGYALDRIAGRLVEMGETSAMIEVGGEVLTLGRHPDDRPWQVAVSDPMAMSPAIHRVVAPGEFAVATSGHSENGLRGRVEVSHIIHPGNRSSASQSIASVTVLARSGIEADALATALCALGFQDGIAMAERLGLSALFIGDGSQTPREVMTGRFTDHVIA